MIFKVLRKRFIRVHVSTRCICVSSNVLPATSRPLEVAIVSAVSVPFSPTIGGGPRVENSSLNVEATKAYYTGTVRSLRPCREAQ